MKKLLASALFFLLAFNPALGQAFTGFAGGSGGGGGGSGTMGSVTIATTAAANNTGTCTSTTTINCSIGTQLTTSNTYTSNQTLASGDAMHQVIFNSGSAATATLNNMSSGNYGRILNKGAGTITLSAGTGSINVGCTSLTTNQSADWQFDGTNWNIACGASSASASGIPANYTTGGTVWYQPLTYLSTVTGGAMQSGTIVCGFGGVPSTVTIKGLGSFETTTSSTNHVSFAVYSVSGGTLTYLSDVGSIVLGASNNQPVNANFSAATGGGPSTVTLSPGTLYAFCANADNAVVVFQSWQSATSSQGAAVFVGSTTLGNTNNGAAAMNGKQIATTYGTWSGTISLGSMSDQTNGASKQPAISFLVN